MPIVRSSGHAESNEVAFARHRLTTRTYATRSFATQLGRDTGLPSRYIYRVFDEMSTDDAPWDWTKHVVYTAPGGRKQLQLHVARAAGVVRKLCGPDDGS